ncbi:MAG: pyrroloquinoline quinone biosynthesis protein PqqE [Alphaproteobacteria bacterium]|jgi:pyrroloquinoline quinone biosynthesis protein E|nr:pyrroloquinoline quinone biosynthesis protein PqqE [Alphaproteobacteria bacterium]
MPGPETKVDGSRTPVWLYCALTYRCPLACATCPNPLDFERYAEAELATAEWLRVLEEARALGTLQVAFTGGEAILRDDLEVLIDKARELQLYSNLITGGVGLDSPRAVALKDAGLNQVRISLPAGDREHVDALTGAPAFDQKIAAARAVKAAGLPLLFTITLCRDTIEQLPDILSLAERLGANMVEVTQVRPTTWAARNREALSPSREQLAATRTWIADASQRLKIFTALDDGDSGRPQLCRNDWGTVRLTVSPDGTALPCRDAVAIGDLAFPNVREHDLDWIWHRSPAFNRFRGSDWMKVPCRDCPDKTVDYGGCRCQAYQLTGDAANADPACALAPDHDLAWPQAGSRTPLVHRGSAIETVT